MQNANLKISLSRVWWFRIQWDRIEYACRESNGSLKPVPVGTTRKKLYCGQCRASKCLFAPGNYDYIIDNGQITTIQPQIITQSQAAIAQARMKGLALNGRPLIPSCWNCQEIRCKLSGYVCRYEPEADPVGKDTMIRVRKVSATGCNRFRLRREMVIPPLDGDENA